MNNWKIWPILLLFFIQASCATIMKEEWEEVFIDSTPPGAQVQVSNGEVCHTPCHLELERSKSVDLTISKEGFPEKKYSINGKSLDGWLWGNLVFLVGLPIAVGVDLYTGYAYDFSPDEIKVDFTKK